MPQKPVRKIKVARMAEGVYTLTYLSPLRDEDEFNHLVEEDIVKSLGERDSVANPDWETRSLTLIAEDLDSFLAAIRSRYYLVEECLH